MIFTKRFYFELYVGSQSRDTIDVCVQLTLFGTSILMYVDFIGYQNPNMLYFYGIINGNEAQLIQHIS